MANKNLILKTTKDRKLLAVVFTDIEGFSALTQKDEKLALKYVARYRKIVTELTEKHHGKIINFYGDGSLSVHESSLDAVKCTIEMQSLLALKPQIPVRIGIHLGEVVLSDETIYGNAVNIASRIQELGKAQSILISGSVAREMHSHPGINIVLIGAEYVKNIKEKVDVYAVSNGDLVVPSRKEIHDKNKRRKNTSFVISALIVIALLVSIFSDIFPFNKPNLGEQRILILPFKNETGDSTLDDFSIHASAYINSLMTDVENIKIVAINNLMVGDEYKRFGISTRTPLLKMTNADNFIAGEFILKNDSTLEISSALLDGQSGKYIEQFQNQLVDRSDYSSGLIQLSERIIGFLISSDYKPLTTPNKDAFHAYIEALRVWNINDYKDSRQYLLRAIQYDSTFLDAYHLLSDTYYNMSKFETVDSLFKEIDRRFKIETQTARQKNQSYYYSALHSGNYKAAYGYLSNIYNEDKEDIFNNTTIADFAMFFVNAPEEAIKILKNVPSDNISYELQGSRYRITAGILAYYATKKYKKAAKLASLYPTKDISQEHRKMRLRAFAGINDTTTINNELVSIKLTSTPSKHVAALLWTSQQFRLQKEETTADLYIQKAYDAMVKDSIQSYLKTEILYGIGDYQAGLEHALKLYKAKPNRTSNTYRVGMGYALNSLPDSAKIYLDKLHALTPDHDMGRTPYKEALIFTALGDKPSALVKLQIAVDDGLIFYEDKMEFDPQLMLLFDLPEFQKIIHPLDN